MPFDPNVRLDQFYSEIATLEKEFVKSIGLLARGAKGSQLDFSLFLTQYDFFNILVEQGYEGTAKKFIDDWDGQVARLLKLADAAEAERVASVNMTDLQVIKQIEYDKLLRRGQDYAGDVQSELLKQLATGADMKTIRERVLPKIQKEMTFYPSWFNAILNTAYSEYNAVALDKVTEDLPNARFVLRGPVDKHTRPACKHAIQVMKKNKQGFTKQEIEEGALGEYKFKNKNGVTGMKIYNFKDRGGTNCRHYFEMIGDSINDEIEITVI